MSRQQPDHDSYTGETVPLHRPPQPERQSHPDRRATRQPSLNVRPPLRPQRRAGRSVGRWMRRIFWLLVVGLALALVGTLYFQQRVAAKVKLADVRQSRPAPNLLVAPMNILLLGVDLRQDNPQEGVRSDTLMLLHLDPAGGWANLLSIPRDSVATIPGFGDNKINAAFARGYENAASLYGEGTAPQAAGAALAADTVEQFLGLPEQNSRINYVATINFNGFAKMIDAVGGVEIDVPRQIIDTQYPTEDFGYTTVRFEPGRQRMDGATALKYVRTRYADSDFGRAERQQQVVRAIVEALRRTPLPLRPIAVLRLLNATGDAVQTTLPVGRLDALLMGLMLARISPDQIGQYRIAPDKVGVQEVGSDLVWNRNDVQQLVRETLSAPGEAKEQATIQVQNGADVAGIAGQLTANLRSQGFTLADPTNAASTETSQIIDYGENPATTRRLSTALGGLKVVAGSSADAPPGVNIVVLLGADYQQYWQPR